MLTASSIPESVNVYFKKG